VTRLGKQKQGLGRDRGPPSLLLLLLVLLLLQDSVQPSAAPHSPSFVRPACIGPIYQLRRGRSSIYGTPLGRVKSLLKKRLVSFGGTRYSIRVGLRLGPAPVRPRGVLHLHKSIATAAAAAAGAAATAPTALTREPGRRRNRIHEQSPTCSRLQQCAWPML
jgi:hypothetical protein